MKKVYTKPIIIIEAFQLDAAVAASCSSQNYLPINYSENTCEHEESGYFGDVCGVDITVGAGGDANDTPCYHGPIYTGGVTFIAS